MIFNETVYMEERFTPGVKDDGLEHSAKTK